MSAKCLCEDFGWARPCSRHLPGLIKRKKDAIPVACLRKSDRIQSAVSGSALLHSSQTMLIRVQRCGSGSL